MQTPRPARSTHSLSPNKPSLMSFSRKTSNLVKYTPRSPRWPHLSFLLRKRMENSVWYKTTVPWMPWLWKTSTHSHSSQSLLQNSKEWSTSPNSTFDGGSTMFTSRKVMSGRPCFEWTEASSNLSLGVIVVYLDDILIFTETLKEH